MAPKTEPVLIVGAGPVGQLLALQLARLGTPSILCEQATETTKWPKMDLTNCRSMEIFRMLGTAFGKVNFADEYRSQEGAVGPDFNFDSIFYTSIDKEAGGKKLAAWVWFRGTFP
jgi:2-polyprenyl-6-methoxyphenol hydroxylase-like FAD-dependent oxidoreductase